jgi:hypothetical protein
MVGDRRRHDRRQGRESSADIERRAADRRQRERRIGSRVPVELWMEEVLGEDVYFRRTGNVSEGGVYFDKAIPHMLGTMVTLKFALPGDREMVVARGEVVSGGGDELGMGVKFKTIEGDGQRRLREFIEARLG